MKNKYIVLIFENSVPCLILILVSVFIANQVFQPLWKSNMASAVIPGKLISTNITTMDNFSTFKDPSLGVKIQYPANWQDVVHFIGPLVIVEFVSPRDNSSDKFQEKLNIAIELLYNKTTLQDYATQSINLLKTAFNASNITESSLSSTLAGNHAVERTFNLEKIFVDKNRHIVPVDIKVLQDLTVIGNKAYAVTFSAEPSKYDAYLPIVQKMVDSFQILLPEAGQNASNIEPTTVANQTTDFDTARAQYLSAWNQTGFHSAFDTFIELGSAKGYGQYQELEANLILPPGQNLELYLEPVGFRYKPVLDEKGNTLYQTNFTADIALFDTQDKLIQEYLTQYKLPQKISHQQFAEEFLTIPFTVPTSIPEGEYKIRYFIKDGNSGETLQLVKNLRVAQILSP